MRISRGRRPSARSSEPEKRGIPVPFVMQMRWAGVTPEMYEEGKAKVRWEDEAAEGGLFHVAWFDDEGLRVVDVWDSPDSFQRFVDQRLLPVLKGEMRVPGEPEVEMHPAYRVWDPWHNAAI
jgi:hypothetical protein